MDTIVLPNVGDKCKAKYIPSVTGVAGREWTNDYVFTVTSMVTDHVWYENGTNKIGPAVWGDFTGPDGNPRTYYVTQWEPVLDTDIVDPPKSEEQQEIERLRAAIIQEQERRGNERLQAIDAIQTIGQRLIDEANRRGWCSQYDEIIEEVNTDLPSWLELPVRQSDYIVSWTEEHIVTVSRSMTVTATSAEEAIEVAQNEDYGADTQDIIDAVRNRDFEYVDGSMRDFEVEED